MRPDRESRPAANRAASWSCDGDRTKVQQQTDVPLVTASVRVDLAAEHFDDALDRRALFPLERIPAGARVVVWIGDRGWLWPSTADLLHRHADRLLIELEGTPEADIRRWLAAVRTGNAGVIA